MRTDTLLPLLTQCSASYIQTIFICWKWYCFCHGKPNSSEAGEIKLTKGKSWGMLLESVGSGAHYENNTGLGIWRNEVYLTLHSSRNVMVPYIPVFKKGSMLKGSLFMECNQHSKYKVVGRVLPHLILAITPCGKHFCYRHLTNEETSRHVKWLTQEPANLRQS